MEDVTSGRCERALSLSVKSMRGERLSAVDIGVHGVIGIAPTPCVRPMVAS